jgi:hypothetical protein
MMLSTGPKVLLAAIGVCVIALSWGYWHSQTHASLNLRVEDYGLKTDNLAYGTPHGVTLRFLGPAKEQLAVARSVEPLGYILAIHPKSEIGNCEHRGIRTTASQSSQSGYAKCYAEYSAWASEWAPLVRRAHVAVGTCELHDLPVTIYTSNADWWLWWVPLPHIGGVPRRYFDFVVKIDSRACASVTR